METRSSVLPVIGVECEHLAKSTNVRGLHQSQTVGAKIVLRALNELVFQDSRATYGLYQPYSYWGAAESSLPFQNGGAAYIDLDQPETNTPEVLSPAAAYLHMCAVEHVTALAVRPRGQKVCMWLMNRSRDGRRGFVYRAGHINIQMRRSDFALMSKESFGTTLRAYVPFLTAVGVLLGSGAVGDEDDDDAFLCCQRCESVEKLFPTYHTTMQRSLTLNLRGLSEALTSDETAIRNHVIGPHDTTLSPTQELRIALVQAATYALLRPGPEKPYPDLTLRLPILATHIWNRDPWKCLDLVDGGKVSAIDVAEIGAAWIDEFVAGDEAAAEALPDWPQYSKWLAQIIDALRRRDLEASGVEWAAKQIAFDGLDSELRADLDTLWHEVTLELFAEGGSHIARDCGHVPPFSEAELREALLAPPTDTRAYIRGHIIQQSLVEDERVEMRNWNGINLPDRRVRVKLSTPESCSLSELGPLEGMTLDEILDGPAEPYVTTLSYGHRYRKQHHTRSATAVSTVQPGANQGAGWTRN